MNKWFQKINKTIENEKSKLFLFPYAGGGASTFRKWKDYFDDIELYAAQYPGRENRINEELITEMDNLVEELYKNIEPLIADGKSYFIFGHSLGTKVAYELIMKISDKNNNLPKGVIISAGRAPCYKEINPIYGLEDKTFIKEINRFSGTPAEIIENEEIMKLFISILRTDFAIDETYERQDIRKIDIPILGLMGTEDSELTLQELKKWKDYTDKDFKYEYIHGGHMFVNTNREDVIIKIQEFIQCVK